MRPDAPSTADSASGFDPAAYWERRLQRFDLSAVGYSGVGLGYNRWLYRIRAVVFRRLLRKTAFDWSSARVLDVGSGTGFYVDEWLRAGAAEVVGSDVTKVATSRLRDVFRDVEFVEWDVAERPPFPPASFDAISAFDVLFHIVDDTRYRSAIANLSSLLRPGGVLLLSENLVHRPAVRIEHQVSRPLEEIEALLRDEGLDVLKRTPMFVVMNVPIDSRSRLSWRIWGLIYRLLVRRPALGGIVGALLFPVELALLLIRREGPGTEAVVCRKRPAVR